MAASGAGDGRPSTAQARRRSLGHTPPHEPLSSRTEQPWVITRVAERSQISLDVNSAFDEKQTFADRLADRVAKFGGSWTFITLFLSTLVAWTILNSVVLAWYSTAFDPYPYIFLN